MIDLRSFGNASEFMALVIVCFSVTLSLALTDYVWLFVVAFWLAAWKFRIPVFRIV